jgi:tripartite-type tricarboxylate transporter receptor subunit TctC
VPNIVGKATTWTIKAAAAIVCAVLVGAVIVRAEGVAYPRAPIRIVACVAAGGGVDIMARMVAQHLQQAWSNPVVVENKAGGGCNIGAELVYNSAPDGYTILAAPPGPFAVNKSLFRSLRYDPANLEPVSIAVVTPVVLAVPAKSSLKSASEFVQAAKAQPGKLTAASQGLGTSGHLISAMLEQKLGTKFIIVPHNGAAPAINSLVGGHVDFMFSDLGGVIGHANAGLVSILATTTEKRVSLIPDVPTLGEIAIPGFIGDAWWGFAAPPGTPLEIRQKIALEINAMVKVPEVAARIAAMGVQPLGNTPAEMQAIIDRDTARWSEVIKAANITIE